MMLINNRSPTYSPSNNFVTFDEDEQLSQIKNKLLKEVNSFRLRSSLDQFYEDHNITKILQNMNISNPQTLKEEDIVANIQNKLSTSDHQILISTKQFSNYGINKENPMASLENHFFDIISKMMQVTHKDNFTNKNFTNISLYLGYDCLQVFLVIVFSNNVLSIEKIVPEEDCFQIIGKLHNINCSIFILLLKFKDFDAIVISPNKMKFDPVNNIFKIIVDKKLIGSNLNFYSPDLEFYVKAGKNSVKYGLGNDISYQEMCRMSSFLKIAYVMPFMIVESSILIQENSFFAKSSSAYQNLRNKSVTFTFSDQQNTPVNKNGRSFLNSPIPNFAALNNNFPKKNLSTIREEPMGLNMRAGVSSLFKDDRVVSGSSSSFRNIENKENICRNSTPRDRIYASNKSNGKDSASSNKMVQERVIDPRTLNFFSNTERRYQTLTTNQNFNSMGDLDSQFNTLSFPFPNQFQRPDYLPNMFEHGFKTEDIQPQGMNNYSCPVMNPFASNNYNYDTNNQWTSNYLTPNTISFANLANPGLFVKNDFCNLPQQQALLENPNPLPHPNPNPNPESHNNNNNFVQLIIPNKQCVTVSGRDFRVIQNNVNFKSYNPRESTIDPNIFKKGEILSEVAKNNLLLLEQKLVADFTLNKVQQYVKLYQSNEMHDVVLTFENGEEIKAHRVVLLQSPYFERVFQTLKSLPNEPVKILMPEYLRANSFKKVLRYMYYAEIETHELDIMDLIMAREILLTAYSLRLYGLMSVVLVRVIIPKMDKLMCVELLKDSFEREDKKSKLIWKTLQHYCLNFFALHSKSILNKYSRLLEGIDTKLIYKMINKALTKCSDIQHMYELLSVLVQSGFASNILDILEKVPFVKEKDRKFDTKYLHNIQELLISTDPKSCYITDLLTNKKDISPDVVNSILEENKQDRSMMEISAAPLSNHLELNLKHNPNSQEFFEPNEWPEIKKMDPVYEMKMQLASGAKNKSIVSQSFDSDSRSWRLILDIEEDYKVSAFLVEKGNPSHSLFGTPFKNEFTSTKFLVQIQHGEIEYETILFHTFANEHHYAVGHRKFVSLPNLAVDSKIQVRVWMMEFPVYSCAVQYISTRFNDLLKATFQDHDISKIITLKPDEKNYLGTKMNNLNQPQYKTGPQLEEKKLKAEAKKRKSMHFLEENFFKESTGLPPENTDYADPLAAHAIHPVTGNLRQATEINRVPSLIPETQQQIKTKPKRFQELNPYDFYYLVSSDYLTIEHEKFLIYFLYKFTLEKSEDMVSLISFGLRFSFIELSKLFNAARDLLTVRHNITFIHKLDFEINMRISSHQPFDRPRKFYSAEMYQNWTFKDDLLRWLIESDHHQGYRLKIEELHKIIKSKEELLKSQKAELDSQLKQINPPVSQHVVQEGLKKPKLHPFVEQALIKKSQQQQQSSQYPNQGVLTLVKDKCNIF